MNAVVPARNSNVPASDSEATTPRRTTTNSPSSTACAQALGTSRSSSAASARSPSVGGASDEWPSCAQRPTHTTSNRVPRVLIVATGVATSYASGRAREMSPATARMPPRSRRIRALPRSGARASYSCRLMRNRVFFQQRDPALVAKCDDGKGVGAGLQRISLKHRRAGNQGAVPAEQRNRARLPLHERDSSDDVRSAAGVLAQTLRLPPHSHARTGGR